MSTTTKRDLNNVKEEILARLDIISEYKMMGVEFRGQPSTSGWLQCRNPYKQDIHPSAGVFVGTGKYRGYLKTFNTSNNWAQSFFDAAA